MQLNSHKLNVGVQLKSQNLGWSIKPYTNPSPHEFQPDTWVKLLELPSRFSFDEALLLCQISEDDWVAWIPDHGEAVLHINEFCQASF
jgi:hypothetical protein